MKLGIRQITSSGYVAHVDGERCIGCRMCVSSCPVDAIYMEGEMAVVDREACIGCGVCISRCTYHAKSLEIYNVKPKPLDVRKLIKKEE